MTADETRKILAAKRISRYSYDKALDSAQMTGYYGIDMSSGARIEITVDSDGFHVSEKCGCWNAVKLGHCIHTV